MLLLSAWRVNATGIWEIGSGEQRIEDTGV
jgi:hypothetical protein